MPKSMSENCIKLQVDGARLLNLTTEGWRELSAPEECSSISIAKVMTEIERLAVAKPVKEMIVKTLFMDKCDEGNRLPSEKEFAAFCEKKFTRVEVRGRSNIGL